MRTVHYGEVTRNTDDELGDTLRGSVFFKSPTITGDTEFSLPAKPCFPYAGKNSGIFFIPEVGDIIEIEIDLDDSETPDPRYRCGVYSSVDEIDELFRINYPRRSGWVTKQGHYLLFDDTKGQEIVKLGHAILGTSIEMNQLGNLIENVVRDKVSEILRNHVSTIAGNETLSIGKDRTVSVKNNESKTISGDKTEIIKGDYNLIIEGSFNPKYSAIASTPAQINEETQGFRRYLTGGGFTHEIGGSKSESIVSNYEMTVGGSISTLVTLKSENVYGTGFSASVGTGNIDWDLAAGNYNVTVIAGNINLTTAAGDIDISTVAGSASIGNAQSSLTFDITGAIALASLLAKMEIDVAGNVTIDGIIVKIGNGTSGVLTQLNNPVVDNITGAPSIPSLKLLSD